MVDFKPKLLYNQDAGSVYAETLQALQSNTISISHPYTAASVYGWDFLYHLGRDYGILEQNKKHGINA